MTAQYAAVSLLDAPYHIDGLYDYAIPPEIREAVLPGVFVTVPFGIHNQLRTGLVEEIRDHSSYRGVKLIHSVLPESMALDREMQGLCGFLKTRTLCTTGDAVRAMIPAAALSRLRELYAIRPDRLPTDSDEIPSSDLFVYEFLREHGETSLPRLREALGIRAERAIRRLREYGWVTRRILYDEPQEGKREQCWSLALRPDTARELIAGRECEGIRLRSPGQRSMLAVLLGEDGPIPTAELLAQAHCSPQQLRALRGKGILRCEERRTNRNPYTQTPVLGQLPLELNDGQRAALETLWSLACAGEPRAALLHGITGSGKTRVMTALIDRLLADGRGVILLLPEIALTPQSVSIFCARYGQRVAVMHSALSAGERYDAYCRIRRGDADVVIGTRSAVFAPVPRLGAIIIDEEQEHTYKSDQNPKYHARDVARYRCAHHKALMLLASATPALESYKKAMDGVYTLVTLTQRCGSAALPQVRIIDMRQERHDGNTSVLGRELADALEQTLRRGEQAILFLNRRGYHRAVTCLSCGKAVVCPHCSVAMTYHTRRGSYTEGELMCHWCGYRQAPPRVCPDCGSEHLGHTGYGTQKLEEEMGLFFPSARVLRMDADTAVGKEAYDRMLGRFRRHEADILLGTQMVTKGHDFPDVTLVGVLMADASLYLDDYRAAERTFAMLTQVIGRAGRGRLPGRAIIQTENPENEVIRLCRAQDYPAFYEREIRLRRLLCFPPVCDIALLTVSGPLEQEVMLAAGRMHSELEALHRQEPYREVELIPFGPFEAPVYRVDNRYRMRMVIKCRFTKPTLELFHELLCRLGAGCGRRIQIGIDLNPSNL